MHVIFLRRLVETMLPNGIWVDTTAIIDTTSLVWKDTMGGLPFYETAAFQSRDSGQEALWYEHCCTEVEARAQHERVCARLT